MKMTRVVKVLKSQLPFLIRAVNSHGKSESLVTKLEETCCKTSFECTSDKSKSNLFQIMNEHHNVMIPVACRFGNLHLICFISNNLFK